MGFRETQPLARPCPYGKEVRVHAAIVQSHSLKIVRFFSKHKHPTKNTFKNEMSYTSSIRKFNKHTLPNGYIAVTQLVEALRYKPEGRGFDSR